MFFLMCDQSYTVILSSLQNVTIIYIDRERERERERGETVTVVNHILIHMII